MNGGADINIQVIASSSKGNCYKISDGTTSILIECGITFKEIQTALDFHLSKIKGCFLTHFHADHSKAAKQLLKFGTDIYTSNGTIEACGLTGRGVKAIKSMNQISLGSFDVLPFDVEHDAPEPLGFLFKSRLTKEKLLFFSDTSYLKYTFPGIDYLMGECNYSLDAINGSIASERLPASLKPRILRSHMSFDTFIDLLKANGYVANDGLPRLKQIYLLHLSSNNSNAEDFQKKVQELCACEVYIA